MKFFNIKNILILLVILLLTYLNVSAKEIRKRKVDDLNTKIGIQKKNEFKSEKIFKINP